MFNSTQLTIARNRRRLSRKELAVRVGLTPVTITRLEAGDNEPGPDNIKLIAAELGFPVDFFYGDYSDPLSKDAVSFRSLKAMTAKERDAAISAADLALTINDWIDDRFNLPEVDLPDLSNFIEDPAGAASFLRSDWGFGQRPIGNLIKLLESKGIRVFSLAEDTKNVDAFSFWRNGQPFIFLNTFKTAERSRFDIAHELGHLVLHRDGENTGRDAEAEANEFASHFLIPKTDLIANIPFVHSLNQLVKAKTRWGVSLQALAYRLHKNGLITDWRYRGFCIEISKLYGNSEPNGIERERSTLWEKIIRELWREGISNERLANEVHIPLAELNSLVFGLFSQDSAPKETNSALRLVK
ncbi:MAG: helix-turn-helix domain-containing protein [Porticoccaceae bacterium]